MVIGWSSGESSQGDSGMIKSFLPEYSQKKPTFSPTDLYERYEVRGSCGHCNALHFPPFSYFLSFLLIFSTLLALFGRGIPPTVGTLSLLPAYLLHFPNSIHQYLPPLSPYIIISISLNISLNIFLNISTLISINGFLNISNYISIKISLDISLNISSFPQYSHQCFPHYFHGDSGLTFKQNRFSLFTSDFSSNLSSKFVFHTVHRFIRSNPNNTKMMVLQVYILQVYMLQVYILQVYILQAKKIWLLIF